MNRNDWDNYEIIDPRSGKETEDQPFAADDDWDDYEIIDPKSGKETEDQPFAADDWDNYEIIDPRSGKETEDQPFAADDDWDDYEIIDPRSGKETEDQPFAADDDWDDYEIIDPRSGKETEDQPFAANDDWDDYSGRVGREAQAEIGDEPTASLPPVPPVMPAMAQQAAVLRTRGQKVQVIRHAGRHAYAVLYTAASGNRYVIDPNATDPRVLQERGAERVEVPLSTACTDLRELLAVIDLMDEVSDSSSS